MLYSLPIVTNCDLASRAASGSGKADYHDPANLQDLISEWNVANRAFVTRGGTEILMGQPVDLEEKFILLEKILEDLTLRDQQATRIDLRVPKSPVISIL